MNDNKKTAPDISLGLLKFGEAENISDRLVKKLLNMILSGTIKPGYMFPNEVEMCKQLNIGRSTLREAYKVLSAYGLITRTKRGTFVNEEKAFSSGAMMDFGLESADFAELFEFRVVLEAETARLATLRATPDDIEELGYLLKQMESVKEDINQFSLYDSAFHLKIAEASHNKLFCNTMKISSESFFKGIHDAFIILDVDGIRRATDYHRKIYAAILARNSQQGMELMRDHINNIIENSKLRTE